MIRRCPRCSSCPYVTECEECRDSSGGVGDTQKSTFTVEKAEANVALEDSWFAFPAGGK